MSNRLLLGIEKTKHFSLSVSAPPLQSPSTPDLLLYGHTHANGHAAFATQQNEANAAAEANEAAIHDRQTSFF